MAPRELVSVVFRPFPVRFGGAAVEAAGGPHGGWADAACGLVDRVGIVPSAVGVCEAVFFCAVERSIGVASEVVYWRRVPEAASRQGPASLPNIHLFVNI